LAFYDRIKNSLDRGFNVTAVGTGIVASAAVLVLAACKHRSLAKNSWVMVHDDTPDPSEVKNMRLVQIDRTMEFYRRAERQWNLLMELNSQTSSDHWDELSKKETYLSPAACLRLGLIEGVI